MCHVMKKFLAVAICAALACPPAYAQEATTPLPGVAESTPEPTTRTAAPSTDDCPFRLTPPKPVTTSERLAPDQAAPTPLPPVMDAACGISAPAGFTVPKDLMASAWIVADIDTGEIIAVKDPHGRYRPASIIKALLALVVIEELDLSTTIEVSEASATIDGSAVGLGSGGTYTVEQLLQGLLMASGNDAAHALAQELGGDESALEKVNALAKRLGTTSTYAASYSGLDAPGMSTSAYDMALIYRAAYSNPAFARLVNTEKVKFPGYGDVPGYELWNDNGLFLNDPDGIGGKTGYTDDANHTFVGALNRNGRRLFAVLLDTTVDHGPRAWQQAQQLLNEAYTVPAGSGVDTLSAQPAESSRDELSTPASTPSGSAPTPAPAATNPDLEPTLSTSGAWVPWLIVFLIGACALAAAFWSISRRPGRHRKR